ncbi:MAG TPA: GH25 family lysozyme [Adlercreutzia equolifaciens]|uniref:GH25 family lysozyme n=1 Tax=Adlercreutzia equolifaciens TaxID=446660 RepID=UPI00242CCB5E|nr:GH25 family lysozyme [Adlercreutzia equolifaciens]HJI12993.1 GH25 family lysozyme [Adlercreutzia equolifaciens]
MPRIATLTRRRFVAGAACAVACAAAGLLVGCGSASKSAEVAAIEPYVSPYDWSGLVRDGEKLAYYENDALCSRWGIDVSEHQGNDIDWAAVADAGVQFAFARIGNRGATEGALSADEFFFQNAVRAGEVGIQVSAYFFSQALTEDEAREEAQFALDNLRETEAAGATFVYVAYDHEPVEIEGARAARRLSGVAGRVRRGSTHRSARLLHLAVHQRRHGSRHPHRRRFECVA